MRVRKTEQKENATWLLEYSDDGRDFGSVVASSFAAEKRQTEKAPAMIRGFQDDDDAF